MDIMKIVFLDADTLGPDIDLTPFNQLGVCTIYGNTSQACISKRLEDVDIAITNKVVFSKEVIKSCNKLKLICVTATGTNNIDLDAANTQGIVVKNVAAYSTDSVVQLTYTLILSLRLRLNSYDTFVKSGDYSNSQMFTHYIGSFSELNNQQVGIIGMGTIGKKSAQVATAFGAKVVYYSTSGTNSDAGYPCIGLEELLSTSDVICIHAPLNKNTFNLLNKNNLCRIKSSAILINVGRGGIVNEKDLADALDEGILAGAGIDVFTHEPIEVDNPLLKIKHPDRLILTPHIAWSSKEARKRLIDATFKNVQEQLINGGLIEE